MRDSRRANVIVLCEDKRTFEFVKCYLAERNFVTGRIRRSRISAGKGSGEQRVRERFGNEVQSFRSKSYQNQLLLVITDSDRYSSEKRTKQLHDQLVKENIEPIGKDEKIGVFIPTWCIESWFLYAYGQQAGLNADDKNKWGDFARQNKLGSSRVIAKRFHNEVCIKPFADDFPESLRVACDELDKIV